MVLIFLFLLGLIVGSFLNVVIVRMETGETVLFGRSRCNTCHRMIRWYDNIPLLSYLLLRGKCRDCKEPISLQYPMVELATGLLFLGLGRHIPVSGDFASAVTLVTDLGLVAALIIVFVYDLRHMEIPVAVLQFAILWEVIASLVLFFLSPSVPGGWWVSGLGSGLIGGAIAYLLFFSLVYFSHETWMGWGDVWLAMLLGLVVGWKLLLPALTIAFGSGALVGIVLLMLGKKGMKSRIPFGPFLVGAVLVFLFFGSIIEERWVMW